LAVELDLACQFLLNRHDMEIEKMRLSIWGDPKNAEPETQNGGKPATNPKLAHAQQQKLTAKEIMKRYK